MLEIRSSQSGGSDRQTVQQNPAGRTHPKLMETGEHHPNSQNIRLGKEH